MARGDDNSDVSKATRLTARQRELIEGFLETEKETARKAGALGVITRIMAQATLPHVDPKLPPGMLYSRSTGLLTLNIAPTTTKYGVPFGTIPRIVLAWICTEAVKTNSRTLLLGHSQREFLEKIQLHSNGRDIARMRDQCMRLFRAVVSVEYETNEGEGSRRLPITNSDTIFWHKNANVQSLWQSELELTEQFFNEVKSHPVPLDLRVYHALSKSPMAMDIYTWLTYRMFVLRASGKMAARIPWVGLMKQLGANYADTKEGHRQFRFQFRRRLREVLLFYPEAHSHVKDEGTYLMLTPCALHLPGPDQLPRLL